MSATAFAKDIEITKSNFNLIHSSKYNLASVNGIPFKAYDAQMMPRISYWGGNTTTRAVGSFGCNHFNLIMKEEKPLYAGNKVIQSLLTCPEYSGDPTPIFLDFLSNGYSLYKTPTGIRLSARSNTLSFDETKASLKRKNKR